jgi:predicted dehydrogenase
MDMKTWNFGIIGAGLIADFHAKAIAEIPNAKLLACCDVVFDKAKKLADKFNIQAFKNYKELLKN